MMGKLMRAKSIAEGRDVTHVANFHVFGLSASQTHHSLNETIVNRKS
jgi:hypothetical protein